SYFFQTPYCAGLSVFFLTLALVFRAADSDSPPDLAAAIFALGALSIFQVSLFFSSCLSLGFLWLYRRFRIRQAWKAFLLEGALIFVGTVGLALLLGGFFNGSAAYSKGLLSFHWPPGYLRYATQASRQAVTGTQALLWYFSTLGSLVLLFPLALIWMVRRAWKNTDFESLFF